MTIVKDYDEKSLYHMFLNITIIYIKSKFKIGCVEQVVDGNWSMDIFEQTNSTSE